MISEAWRTAFSTDYTHDTRLYFNPRGIEYPAITDTLTYSQDEGLGSSWCASGGAASYLIDCTQPTAVSCMVKVQAASDYIFRWYTAAGNLFGLYSNASSQVYGNFNNGTGYTTSAVTVGTAWVKVDLAIISNQLTLWVNNSKVGPVTIGAIAAALPIIYVNAATAKIKHLRILKYSATEAQITSMFSGVPNAEIYGDFAKRSLLSERCNITEYFHNYTLDKSLGYNATNASVQLHNQTGVFTDDAATGCAGYWKGDSLPDMPDDPAGVTYRSANPWATLDGWAPIGSDCALSISNGRLAVAYTTNVYMGFYKDAIPYTGKTVRLTVLDDSKIAGVQYFDGSSYVTITAYSLFNGYRIYDFAPAGSYATSPLKIILTAPALGDVIYVKDIYIGTGAYLSKVVDNSGNGVHGTVTGVTPVDTALGRMHKYDGVNDFILTSTPTKPAIIALGAYIDLEAYVAWAAPISTFSTIGKSGWGWSPINATTIRVYAGRTGTTYQYKDITCSIDLTGHHVVCEWDTVTRICYAFVDGAEAGHTTAFDATINLTASAVIKGRWATDYSDYYLNGIAGRYLAYTRRLTTSEHQKYAAGTFVPYFAPEYNQYNGTEFDEYLQRRTGLWIEEYLPSAYSAMPVFHGWAAPGAFARSSSPQSGSEIAIKAVDFTQDLGRRSIRKARYWEDLLIADASDSSNSLFHQVAYLGTKKEIYNYLCNSSFENATIANSWGVSGGTLARTSGGLCGSYYGALATQGAVTSQTCTIPLSSGERFTFQCLIYGSATVSIELDEYEGATLNGSSSQYANVALADGWKLAYITHDIIDSGSDRLICKITLSSGATVGLDNAGLYYGEVKYGYINNTNDGTAGVCDYTQAMLGTYDIIGVHSDTVNYTHPWATVNPGEKVWDILSSIGDASIAKYMRITNEDVLTLASNFSGTAETNNGAIQGTSGKILSLSSGVQSETANKVKVQGAYITKKPNIECVWEARASALAKDSTESGSPFSLTVANGDYFPDLADSPDGYEALYGDAFEDKK